jgi:hypothetical protein
MKAIIFALSWVCCFYADAGEIDRLLMPEAIAGNSFVREIDWLIEDVTAPKTAFESAVAEKLSAVGVTSSVSSTYTESGDGALLISLEIYQFDRDFNLEDAVNILKIKILASSEKTKAEMSGFEVLKLSISNSATRMFCVKNRRLLILMVAVNNRSDLDDFAQTYLQWLSDQVL